MTRLTPDLGVPAALAVLGDVRVAVGAGRPTRERDRLCLVVGDGSRAEVAVHAEVRWHQPRPKQQERDNGDEEDTDEPDCSNSRNR